jgi:hypothetical protein
VPWNPATPTSTSWNPDQHPATALTNQSGRLSELGRREDALAAIDQAVTSRRQLAAARPKVFSGDLATSLRVQARVLDSLDRSIDAAQLRVEADELE